MTRIHDLLDLPEAVRKGDFVQGLADGIARPELTLRDYAITPKILQSFRDALSVVKSALEDNRSQACYLDGSFGSGKSHFMAVLSLLLSDHAIPWARPELHPLRETHPWAGKKKLVQLPIHMLDARDMESKLLGTYVRWVAANHPEAVVPPVYQDEQLFVDAQRLRERMGDEAFFAELNGGTKQAASGWGKRAKVTSWDGASFDSAIRGTYLGDDERDQDSPRGRLFTDLTRTFFSSFTNQQTRFVDLDAGLGIVSRHAKALGYEGIVFFLDELILWLAGRAGDLPFVGREVQKLVKLKEAQDASRAIPIVSFIARQRDLSDFLGDEAKGAIRAQLSRNLSHHEGRFDKIQLADSNLPAIIKHRVVRPKDTVAAETLKDDFARAWRSATQAVNVLIGSEGDEDAFRLVYPFSPALVEALVALSDCLQRERTAIRILMELLVHHLPDLELGKIVPVGDAFDALAESEDPIDDPVMKSRFDRARDLYRQSFLPIIQRKHGTESPDKCQRLRDEHDRRLGCSGCPQRACRNDNRFAKTLLMAALVPEARPFKGLTVKRLVHLNHGSIVAPFPGSEVSTATSRLREWAGQIGALRIGDQNDPEVSLHLAGVELQPILAKAAEADKPGARRNALRKLLFRELRLESDGSIVDTEQTYFGTKRPGRVRYGNVREMDDSSLMVADGHQWQVVLDYPFDDRGHGPNDDLARVERFRDAQQAKNVANPTMVWLPTFFSRQLENELGDLVVLDHILDGDTQAYIGHLRVEDQHTAKADLTSMRAQKEAKIRHALSQAYGLTRSADSASLDLSRAVDEHFVSLLDELQRSPVLAGHMADGLKQLVDALLSKRYPHHPKFTGVVTATRIERVRAHIEELLESPDRRIAIERQTRELLRDLSDPLGLTETSEVSAMLRDQPLQEIEQRRQQVGLESPTVAQVRKWLDPQGTRGLVAEVEDLLILTWVTWSGRALMRHGKPLTDTPRPGHLPNDVQLERPDLPTAAEWNEAIVRAGTLFGVTQVGRALTARNVAELVAKVKDKLKDKAEVLGLVKALELRLTEWPLAEGSSGESVAGDSPRLVTARACAELVTTLEQLSGAPWVRALVVFSVRTSLGAMGRSLSSATAVKARLEARSSWVMLEQARRLKDDATRSNRARILEGKVAGVLAADEINQPLGDNLGKLEREAEDLLKTEVAPKPKPVEPEWRVEPGWKTVVSKKRSLVEPTRLAEELRQIALEIEQAAAGAKELRVDVEFSVTRRES